MSFIVATHRYPEVVDLSALQHTGYTKKYSEITDALNSKELLDGFDEKRHARIHTIKFHTGQHIRSGDVHREKEITAFWEGRYIDFDPKESLENPIRLVEKESDKVFQKSDYFVLKKLVLTSNQTNTKILQDEFKRTITYNFDLKEEKQFEQTIRVINSDHSLVSGRYKDAHSSLIDIEECRREIEEVNEKYRIAYEGFYKNQGEIFKNNLLVTRNFKNSLHGETFADWKFD